MGPSKDSPTTRIITASEFRAKCLQLMNEVAATGEAIIITKRGKPIANLLPLEDGHISASEHDVGKG